MQTPAVTSQCTACVHLDREALEAQSCEAFPSGIPEDIYTNKIAHTSSVPGDNGIHLELIPLEQYRGPRGEA
jgi:hypothetical protein